MGFRNTKIPPHERLPLAVGIIGFLATLSIWLFVQIQTESNLRQLNLSEAKILQQELYLTFSERVRALERMAGRLSLTPPPTSQQWQADALNTLAHFKDMKVISVTDSSSIIRDIAPMETYRAYKDSLVFSRDPKRQSATDRVKKTGKPTITGLVERKAGGPGIVIVVPIFKRGKVERFLLATLQPDQLFSGVIANERHDVEILEDGELLFSNVSEETRVKNSKFLVESTTTIYDVDFGVRAFPKAEVTKAANHLYISLLLPFGWAISLLLAMTLRFARSSRRRETEIALLMRRMNSVLSFAPVGIFETDVMGECTFVNGTYSLYTGLTFEEAMNQGWRRAIHPDDRAKVATEWMLSVEEKREFQLRFRYQNPHNGSIRWVDCRSVAVFSPQGALIGYLGASLDVTAQKIAEDKFNESQKFLSIVLDTLPVALFCKDSSADFKFTLWNRAAEKIWGLKQPEVLGKADFDLFSPAEAEKFRAEDQEAMSAEGVIEVQQESVTTANAGTVVVRTKKVVVPDQEGQPRFLLGVSEDITKKIQTENLLEEQKIRLVQAERMTLLGEMAGGIAHEINNPLTIIEGYAHRIQAAATPGELDLPRILKAADSISATVLRIAKIIKGLRAFARDGQNDPFEVVKISTLVDESLEFCQEKFQKKGVKLEVEQADKSLDLHCRKVQISQVILNLLNNSFDAVQNTPKAKIKISIDGEDQKVIIRISDSGHGIPPENRGRVMNPFFTTKEPGKGTGLGLSISSNIVASHRGSLILNTQSEKTEFVIELPRQKPPAEK